MKDDTIETCKQETEGKMRGKINIDALHSFPFVAYFATTFYKFNPCLLTSDLFISLSTFLPRFSKLRNKMSIKNSKWTLEERGCVNTLVIVGDSYLLWILAVRNVSKSKDTVIIKLLWASKGEILIIIDSYLGFVSGRI